MGIGQTLAANGMKRRYCPLLPIQGKAQTCTVVKKYGDSHVESITRLVITRGLPVVLVNQACRYAEALIDEIEAFDLPSDGIFIRGADRGQCAS